MLIEMTLWFLELQLCQTRNGRIFEPFEISLTDSKLFRHFLMEEYMTYKIREGSIKPILLLLFSHIFPNGATDGGREANRPLAS